MLKSLCLNSDSGLLRGKAAIELQSLVSMICQLGNEFLPVLPFDLYPGSAGHFPDAKVLVFLREGSHRKPEAWLQMLQSSSPKIKVWMPSASLS